MTTAVLTHAAPRAAVPSTTRYWPVVVAVVVGFGYWLTDHSIHTSQRAAFTQTADEMEHTAEGGNAIRRLTFLTLGAFGAVAALSPAACDRRFAVCGMAFGLYVLWCVTSVLWSEVPGTTVRRLFVLVCFAAGAAGVAKQLNGREFLHVVLLMSSCYLAAGFLVELALGTFRPQASDYRFSGTLHPNTQGLNIAALCFSAVMLARSSPRAGRYWAAFAFGFFFLMLTKSRTSAAGVLFSLAIVWTLGTDFRLKAAVGLLGALFGSGALLAVLFAGIDPAEKAAGAALMGREEQAESLTGRLPIWTAISPFLAERPVVGWGYDSFWTPPHIDTVSKEVQWGVREAHNAYLDTILSTGVVGLGLLLSGVFAGWARAGAAFVRGAVPVAGFAFALTCFSVINGFTESGMIMPIYAPFILTAALLKTSVFPDPEIVPA